MSKTPLHFTRPRLSALFAGVLAGCSGGDPATSADPSDSTSTTSADSNSTTSGPGGPTSASVSVSASGSASGSASASSATSVDPYTSYDPPVCVYDEAYFTLTPAELQKWLDGEYDTTGGDTDTGTGTDTDTDTGTGTGTGTGTDATSTTGAPIDVDPGDVDMALCEQMCNALVDKDPWQWIETCQYEETDPDGNFLFYCYWLVESCDGRDHASICTKGLVPAREIVSAWLARAAHDEAASVHAFAALRRELAEHDAPRSLRDGALAAARDELGHAREMAALVALRGARCPRPEVRPIATRTLLELGVENATCGCVGETWAALRAAYQAQHAASPELRVAMYRVAIDEVRHAELAWAIDAWIREQLDEDGRQALDEAVQAAAARVREGAAERADETLVRAVGLPRREHAMAMADALTRALWT